MEEEYLGKEDLMFSPVGVSLVTRWDINPLGVQRSKGMVVKGVKEEYI